YDPPVISRIWSLDHPIEIKPGMTFALETQHGKKFRYGVRIEEMLIVHEKEIEIVSNFPVKQITVVDPIPGYADHVRQWEKHRSPAVASEIRGGHRGDPGRRSSHPGYSPLRKMSEDRHIIPLPDAGPADPDRVGPKAANLAALAQADLPTPGGFALTA